MILCDGCLTPAKECGDIREVALSFIIDGVSHVGDDGRMDLCKKCRDRLDEIVCTTLTNFKGTGRVKR